jgi:hypothetical protein
VIVHLKTRELVVWATTFKTAQKLDVFVKIKNYLLSFFRKENGWYLQGFGLLILDAQFLPNKNKALSLNACRFGLN